MVTVDYFPDRPLAASDYSSLRDEVTAGHVIPLFKERLEFDNESYGLIIFEGRRMKGFAYNEEWILVEETTVEGDTPVTLYDHHEKINEYRDLVFEAAELGPR